MNRLRQAGDSHYDVLGVSPRASADEIDSAFRQLIDGEGYKAGVPLNRQWLRARQIKDAHATLGDPAMRQAYDESLHQVPGPAPWALTAEDPATDELVVPGPRADEPPATGSTPEPGPEGLPGPEAQEQLADDDQPPADLEPTSNDNEIVFDPAVKDNQRWSLRAWGAAAAVAGVLGLLILTPWPGLDRQSSAGDEASRVVAAGQESGAGQGFVDQVLGAFNRSASPNPQVDEADAPPAASSAARPDLQGKSGEETVLVDAAVTASATTAAHPQANATSTSTAPAEATTSSVEAVEAQATAPTPPAAPAPAIATAGSGNAESSARLVHIPPQWVGGGPTDADNPRGRYQGSLTVQVSVEADGSVSKCAPVRGSGNAGLDEMTCRLVRERARFSPALDAQRRPVAAQAYTTIVWGRDRRR